MIAKIHSFFYAILFRYRKQVIRLVIQMQTLHSLEWKIKDTLMTELKDHPLFNSKYSEGLHKALDVIVYYLSYADLFESKHSIQSKKRKKKSMYVAKTRMAKPIWAHVESQRSHFDIFSTLEGPYDFDLCDLDFDLTNEIQVSFYRSR